MPSQLESLKKALQERLEANNGRETPFVQGLRAQIASLEKLLAENPVQMYSAGMRSAPRSMSEVDGPTPLPSNQSETEQDGIRAEALRRLKVRRMLQTQADRTPGSSPSPSNTPATTASPSDVKPNTSR